MLNLSQEREKAPFLQQISPEGEIQQYIFFALAFFFQKDTVIVARGQLFGYTYAV